jgi:hypothetical protein
MKLKSLTFLGIAVVLLSSCVPVPSYSVDSYIGSLDRCLNIEGTYEIESYYRNYLEGFVDLNVYFGPGPSYIKEKKVDVNFTLIEKREEKRVIFKKAWRSFRILDSRYLETILFNIDGQSSVTIIDMNEKQKVPSRPVQHEEFTCNQSSWQRAYSSVSYRESGSDKTRRYSKTTKLPNGTLRIEAKYDEFSGAFGLYRSYKNVDRVGYFRKVDLTVEDIRAMNDKAKRAIEQYDQVATTPPPQ